LVNFAKLKAAQAAIEEIKNVQKTEAIIKIGLGTGSTARFFVDLLGEMVANGYECICVPTSIETEKQALALGIKLADIGDLGQLDVTVDGADEIDPQLGLIKGGGGALLREKIVASASKRMIVISDDSKMVEYLGAFPLPIEVNKFGLGATKILIEKILGKDNLGKDNLGMDKKLELRKDKNNQVFVTDGGHFIYDAFFSRILDANTLSRQLLDVAGVVQHGLFLDMCDTAFVASDDGVKRYDK